MDRLFIRGRVVARTFDEAMDMLRARVEAMGYRLKPRRTVKPSPVQPWDGVMCFDYNVEVEEIA